MPAAPTGSARRADPHATVGNAVDADREARSALVRHGLR